MMKGCDKQKMKEMVRLQGISKKFGNNVIIPSLDLTIYDGEFIRCSVLPAAAKLPCCA